MWPQHVSGDAAQLSDSNPVCCFQLHETMPHVSKARKPEMWKVGKGTSFKSSKKFYFILKSKRLGDANTLLTPPVWTGRKIFVDRCITTLNNFGNLGISLFLPSQSCIHATWISGLSKISIHVLLVFHCSRFLKCENLFCLSWFHIIADPKKTGNLKTSP